MLSLSEHLYQNNGNDFEDDEDNDNDNNKKIYSTLDAQMFDECDFVTAKQKAHNTALSVGNALRSRLASSDKAHNKLV